MNPGLAIALAWGFGEATFFFLVPDVWLTFLALESFPKAIAASLASLAGALHGGALMWLWGRLRPAAARRFLVRIPAISQRLLQTVDQQVESRGLLSVFTGPLRGIPYKIYAVECGRQNRSLLLFLLISIPARYIRFFLAVGGFWLLGKALPLSLDGKRIVVALFWLVFYTFYFRRPR
jgi:membrane protein DedA with SNARE-associated domain